MIIHLFFPNNRCYRKKQISFTTFETAVNVEARRAFLIGKEYNRVVTYKHGLWSQKARVRNLALSFTSYVTLSKLLDLS